MKFCSKCGKELHDEAVMCVHCGCATEQSVTKSGEADAPSGGFWALGFFIPLAGLILYLVNKDTKPLKAKSAGKGALFGFITSMVVSIIYVILVAILAASLI